MYSPECPVQLLLRTAAGGDVDGKQELLEVDVAILVGVESAKHMVTELVGIARRKALRVDLHEGLGRQLAVGTVALEASIPLLWGRACNDSHSGGTCADDPGRSLTYLDGVLVISRAALEELEVVLAQTVLAALLTHVDKQPGSPRLVQMGCCNQRYSYISTA